MRLEIRLDLDNAAFHERGNEGAADGAEVARILRELADRIEDAALYPGGYLPPPRDSNGNTCGGAKVRA